MNIVEKIKGLVEKGHERSVRTRKNILASIVFRGGAALMGYLTLPLSLMYLDKVQLGIFLALASMIDWFGFLDLGLGKGLRNKIGEAMADNKPELAKTYISSAYFMMAGIFAILFLLFLIVNPWISWTGIMDLDASFEEELSMLASIVMFAFCLKFVFGLVYEVFDARQKIAMIYLFDFIAKAIFLVLILLLIQFSSGSIMSFGIARSFTFGLMPIAVGLIFFRTWFKELRPSWRHFHLKYAKVLTTLGIKFFVIMVALLIIRQTNYFLIIRYVGPEYVVQYEAAFKVFSVVVLLFQLATRPLWSAYVEAYHKEDFDWIRKVLKQMIKLWLLTVLGVAIVLLFVDHVYDIWLQGKVQVPFLLSALVAITMLQTTWISIFNIFINGTGKIQLQMYITLVACLINIPLSIFLVQHFEMGAAGIVLGSVLCLLGTFIMGPIQVRKILTKTDHGIWGR